MLRRNLVVAVVVLGLLGVFALACCCPVSLPQNTQPATDTTTNDLATIKGTVVEKTDGETKPVGNMNITLGDRATTTNDSGYFEISGLDAGTYELQVTGGDYGWQQTVTISAGETQDLGTIELGP